MVAKSQEPQRRSKHGVKYLNGLEVTSLRLNSSNEAVFLTLRLGLFVFIQECSPFHVPEHNIRKARLMQERVTPSIWRVNQKHGSIVGCIEISRWIERWIERWVSSLLFTIDARVIFIMHNYMMLIPVTHFACDLSRCPDWRSFLVNRVSFSVRYY